MISVGQYYVTFKEDVAPNEGGFYCQIYDDINLENEIDNFVISKEIAYKAEEYAREYVLFNNFLETNSITTKSGWTYRNGYDKYDEDNWGVDVFNEHGEYVCGLLHRSIQDFESIAELEEYVQDYIDANLCQ